MIIREIQPAYFGSFYSPCTISLEEDITIFTGANDTGKSCALHAIEHFCLRTKLDERFVNIDRHGEFSDSWTSDTNIQIKALLEVTKFDSIATQPGHKLKAGDIVNATLILTNPGSGYKVDLVTRGASKTKGGHTLPSNFQNVISIEALESIHNIIELNSPNSSESGFLKLAFGAEFSASMITSLSEHRREVIIDQAQGRINERLRSILPESLELQFRLRNTGDDARKLSVSITDQNGAYTPVELRGAGIGRIISIMTQLMQESYMNQPTIVLIDEPETSLHADAQHQLRRALERIAAMPTVQIVYATHSSAMMSNTNPKRIRLFSRKTVGEKATTEVETTAYGDNFQKIRISLGLTPSDSLIYGSVTVIVEGDTEVRCLEPIVNKVKSRLESGDLDIDTILEGCLFVSGEGDNIPKYCRIAVAQNASPVVLLDGDKLSVENKIKEIDASIPIVKLGLNKEFEDLVPIKYYIDGVKASIEAEDAELQIDTPAFRKWIDDHTVSENVMTSKRVANWIAHELEKTYSKHLAMEKAIELCPIDEINIEPIDTLLRAIADRQD